MEKGKLRLELNRWFRNNSRAQGLTLNNVISTRGIMQENHYLILSCSMGEDKVEQIMKKKDRNQMGQIKMLIQRMYDRGHIYKKKYDATMKHCHNYFKFPK